METLEDKMKAIILAGGKGERLRPLTYTLPKPLLPFRGKEMMIEHIFDMLKKYDIKDVTLTLCYLPNVFKEKIGDGKNFGLNVDYIVENEQEPLGTAGFLRNISITETTLVINSDVFFTNLDVAEFLEKHKEHVKKGAVATLVLSYVENTEGLGTVKMHDNKIKAFVEKGYASNYINAGHYLLEPSVIDLIQELPAEKKKIMFEKEIFPSLAVDDKLYAYPSKAEWIHVRDLEVYEAMK